MKNILLFILFSISVGAAAQPTLVHNWSTPVNTVCTNSGLKYYNYTGGTLTVYNEDYSVAHSFNLSYPANSEPFNVIQLYAPGVVSNDGLYSYVISWFDTAGGHFVQGSGLFKEGNVSLISGDGLSVYINGVEIIGGSSAELSVSHNTTQAVDVYSLPGCVPQCSRACGLSGIVGPDDNNQGKLEAFPVPSSGRINLSYELPEGIYSGTITLYNISGQEVKRMAVSNKTGIISDNPSIAAGSYYYQLSTAAGNTVRKIVFIQ